MMHWLLLSPDTLSLEERRQCAAVLFDNWDKILWEVTRHSGGLVGSPLHLQSKAAHLCSRCFNPAGPLQTQRRATG